MYSNLRTAGLATALLAAVAAGPASADHQRFHGNAANGLRLFLGNCMICHGANGKGNGPYAANLAQKPTSFANPEFMKTRTHEDVYNVISKGGTASGKAGHMRAWGFRLSGPQIADLVAYIDTLSTGSPIIVSESLCSADGEKLYVDLCSSCHGKAGRGDGTLSYALKDAKPADLAGEKVQKLSDDQLFRAIKGAVGPTGAPLDVSMPAWGSYLKDEKIRSVTACVRQFASNK